MMSTRSISALSFYRKRAQEKKKKKKEFDVKNKRKLSELTPEKEIADSVSDERTFGKLDLPESKRVRFNDEIDGQSIIQPGIEESRDKTDSNSLVKLIKKTRENILSRSKMNQKKKKTKLKKIKLKEQIKKKIAERGLHNLDDSTFNIVDAKISEDIVDSPQKLDEELRSDTRSFNLPLNITDSREQSRRCFQWLISPCDVDHFMRTHWEREPLLIKRRKAKYYHNVFSTADLDRILRERHVEFTKHIDITLYENDERKTLNPDGRAYAAVVWDYYRQGHSVRLLNPQTFSKSVWKLNSILQEFFGSNVGANTYLTPPGSQGFAPHYDDIEAFILQLEGRKTWRVYSPMSEDTILPRFSSGNFKRHELRNPPLMTVELEPGDLLYFPRGYIHEAVTTPDIHSLHITISTAQKHTFGDFIEKALPGVIEKAMLTDLEYRYTLPVNCMQFLGSLHRSKLNSDREKFHDKVKYLLSKLIDHIDIDSVFDQMAKHFLHVTLPPVLTNEEKASSIHAGGESWCPRSYSVIDGYEIDPETQIKLIRYSSVCVVREENTVRLYHNFENSYDPNHTMDPQYVLITEDFVAGVEYLIKTYPDYTLVEDLPLRNVDDKLELAGLLYDKGLIMIIQRATSLNGMSD